MSKQSRAKSHARRKSQGTGTTVAFVRSIRYMPDTERFYVKSALLDELHGVLCDRRSFSSDILGLFYCELWTDIEDRILAKRISDKRTRALELIIKIKAFYNYE